MATTIYFNGRLISVPGSYSEVDASALEQIGLGASGIVAVLGTAEGGKPASQMTEAKDFIRLTKPEQTAKTFRTGDLLEVGNMLFAPSKDAAIPGGAQQIVPMKVNPATRSTVTLSNAHGAAIILESDDYGAFTEQINAAVQAGTNKGKLLTIKFENITESVDDLGGDALFNLEYEIPVSGDTGWAELDASVVAGGAIKVDGRRTEIGLSTDLTGTQLSSNTKVEIVSDTDDDIGVSATVYGLNAAGVAVKEVIVCAGTAAQASVATFSKVAAVIWAGAGSLIVRVLSAGATITTVTAASKQGLVQTRVMYSSGGLTTGAYASGSTEKLILEGKAPNGTPFVEVITLTGDTPVTFAGKFIEITGIVLGLVAPGTSVVVLSEAAKASPLSAPTLQKAKDYYNARSIPDVGGFIMTLTTAQTGFLLENLDVSDTVLDVIAAAQDFFADQYAMTKWVNQNSQFVSATLATGRSGGAPSNTSSPLFLSGGSEGTALFSHWQQALNLLKKTRINSVVVLTADPAVHAALDAHCAYMCGIGRSERDGFVGLLNDDQTGLATKAQVKEQIIALNSRHIRAYAQNIDRFNTAGERATFGPMFLAALNAGAQAGAPVGEPLTFKYLDVLSFTQHSTWNPTDDAEEMIQGGLAFLENVDGKGRRIVRNVTTYLLSNNIAFIEGSVNQAVNFAVYNFRTNMETAVGKRGFAGTINAAKGVAVGTLGQLTDNQTLVAWRSLNIDLTVDVMEVSVEMAPVIPVNFVKNTIHLVTVQQSAA